MTQPVRKAVFPVAGLGTRFLPATRAIPKEMLPVVDKPLIQWAVEEAASAGIEEFIFVTAPGKEAIEAHFGPAPALDHALEEKGKDGLLRESRALAALGAHVTCVLQPEPLGLGHAVWCAREQVGGEPFAVLLPDDMVLDETPCLQQMVAAYGKVGGNLVAVEDVPREHTNRYGIVDPGDGEDTGERGALVAVAGLVEKPDPSQAPSTLSVIGRYILQPRVFELLEAGERGAGGEIQLTDALAGMIGDMPFHGLRFSGERFDCGDKIGYLRANMAYARDRDDLRDAVAVLCKAFV
ncbi:MAG: UTP--glucose-1-phosphate uridylyltransferase [Alphaproteobacteria bacterium]|nr:UTP--glucose-1-phosphate uridylyltransferase [Alphaproteobacteria bacterium]